jgi:hypothetical protein
MQFLLAPRQEEASCWGLRGDVACGYRATSNGQPLVRQEIAGDRLEDGEDSRSHKQKNRDDQKRPAVTQQCLQEAAIAVGQKNYLSDNTNRCS